jgi:uncharacterized membrane protein HdeD (DUF308 family)
MDPVPREPEEDFSNAFRPRGPRWGLLAASSLSLALAGLLACAVVSDVFDLRPEFGSVPMNTALLVVLGAGLNAFGVARVYVALSKTRPPFEGWGWVCQAAGWALILSGVLYGVLFDTSWSGAFPGS